MSTDIQTTGYSIGGNGGNQNAIDRQQYYAFTAATIVGVDPTSLTASDIGYITGTGAAGESIGGAIAGAAGDAAAGAAVAAAGVIFVANYT